MKVLSLLSYLVVGILLSCSTASYEIKAPSWEYIGERDPLIERDSIHLVFQNPGFFWPSINPKIHYAAEISTTGRVHITAIAEDRKLDTAFYIPADTAQQIFKLIEANVFDTLPDVIEPEWDHAVPQTLIVVRSCVRKEVWDYNGRLYEIAKAITHAIHMPEMFGDPLDHATILDTLIDHKRDSLIALEDSIKERYLTWHPNIDLNNWPFILLTQHEIDSLRATPNPPQWRYR